MIIANRRICGVSRHGRAPESDINARADDEHRGSVHAHVRWVRVGVRQPSESTGCGAIWAMPSAPCSPVSRQMFSVLPLPC